MKKYIFTLIVFFFIGIMGKLYLIKEIAKERKIYYKNISALRELQREYNKNLTVASSLILAKPDLLLSDNIIKVKISDEKVKREKKKKKNLLRTLFWAKQ